MGLLGCALLLVLSWWLALAAWAQAVPAASPAGVASASPAARPIAVGEILLRADEDQQRLDLARRLLAAPDPVDGLRAALDAIARPVDAKLRIVAGGTLRTLPVMRVESLARHWQFDARRFARWEARSRRALAPYTDSAVQLAQRREAWSATRAEGLLDGLPSVLAGRVDAMLSQIDVTEAELGAVLERQFALLQQAGALKARIESGNSDVAQAMDDIGRRLLQMDAPPLWEGLGPRGGAPTALSALKEGIDIERQFAVEYHAADSGNQHVLRAVQILLLPLILWLVARGRGAPGGTATADRMAPALRRPVSAWLLLSLLAVLLLEPDAPLLVQEVVMLLALVPVLRLLPGGTLRALGVWPYLAVALYALDRLGVAAVVDPGIYRLYLLALGALALVLTVWMLRTTVPASRAEGRRLYRALRSVGLAALGLLGVAIASNVAGNVSLAETLTSGIIDSGYMALLLYAAVAAALGIVRALLGQPELAGRRHVQRYGAVLETRFARLVVLVASLGWLLYAMDRFRVLRPMQEIGTAVLGLGVDAGQVSIHLGDILVFALSAWLAFWAARAVRRLLRDELPGHAGLPRGVGNSVASLSYYGVLLLGLLLALSVAGFQVSQLALVFGALGVGIGFGLQNVVNNFVSGLVLMVERPIQPGDIVDAAGSSGTVREIGLRATTIRTFDGADVVVPNGLLLSGNLTNWTMFDRCRRIEIPVGVAYGADPQRVLALLDATVRATPGVAAEPAPTVLMTGLGDSALNFVVRAWTLDIDAWGTLRGELLARILAALQDAGIAVPYNQLDLHLRTVPPSLEAWAEKAGAGRSSGAGKMDP